MEERPVGKFKLDLVEFTLTAGYQGRRTSRQVGRRQRYLLEIEVGMHQNLGGFSRHGRA